MKRAHVSTFAYDDDRDNAAFVADVFSKRGGIERATEESLLPIMEFQSVTKWNKRKEDSWDYRERERGWKNANDNIAKLCLTSPLL